MPKVMELRSGDVWPIGGTADKPDFLLHVLWCRKGGMKVHLERLCHVHPVQRGIDKRSVKPQNSD